MAPVVGGLASLAAAALEAGDHYVQTQRITKVQRHIVRPSYKELPPPIEYVIFILTASIPTTRGMVYQIADMAPDVIECSKLVKRVALEITEGLRDIEPAQSPRVEVRDGPLRRTFNGEFSVRW